MDTNATLFNDSFGLDNSTEDLLDRNIFILPVYRQLIWCTLFFLMIVVATIGNIIIMGIIILDRRMRTVTNYFLFNLSLADFLVSTMNVTFNFVYMLNSHWPFGDYYCKVSQFIAVLTICASVFTLMFIAIDRYIAIVKPLKPRMGKRATLFVCFIIWFVSAIISLPMYLYHRTERENYTNGDVRIICLVAWPNGLDDEYTYNIVFAILTYFVPVVSMMFAYIRIGMILWGSQTIGENTEAQQESIRSKRRVVKMMIVVVTIFAVCWLPFHMYFIVTSVKPEITQVPHIQEIYLTIYWLAMSNSMYNPMIYCYMNLRFRKGFLRCFICLPCVRRYLRLINNRAETMTSRRNPYIASRSSRNGVHFSTLLKRDTRAIQPIELNDQPSRNSSLRNTRTSRIDSFHSWQRSNHKSLKGPFHSLEPYY